MVFEQNTKISNHPSEACLQQNLLLFLYKEIFEEDLKVFIKLFEREVFQKVSLAVCSDCSKMVSLPQGALLVCKLRENHYGEDQHLIARKHITADKHEFDDNQKLIDYNPVKYNEKLMKSIWNSYNRYSPHNIKTNTHEKNIQGVFLQQPMAVAPYVVAENIAMTLHSTKEWLFGEKRSQQVFPEKKDYTHV